MGCNCKTQGGFETSEKISFLKTSNKEKVKLVVHYFFKIIGFLFGILLLPIINIAIIFFMFNTIVLTKDVNIGRLLGKLIGKKYNDEDEDDDEDDDFEDLTEDDVIMLDVEDITEKN